MKHEEIEKIINEAFENKQNISESSDKKILNAINETIELTDKGSVRVAEKRDGKWIVNQWVKKAILLSFKVNKMTMSKGPTLLGLIKFLENQLHGMRVIGKKQDTDMYLMEL